MRVVVCSEFAPLDRLRIEERDSVDIRPGDVRVSVAAAGVSFVDGLIVQGLYQVKPTLPFVPGNEIAGRVVEIGGDVTTFALGDRVVANVGFGGFASEVIVPERHLRRAPSSLSDGQAATFIQSYTTAWYALRHRAQAQTGQWLLVLGAGGGVGLAAVDVGRSMGLRVIAAASTAEKRAVAQAHGAIAVIDTVTEDTRSRAREIADGDGVDLVYDPVGGVAGEQALRALRDDGQLLVVGFASGAIPNLPANQVLLRNRRVTGVDWGTWANKNAAANRQILHELTDSIERGEISPVEPTAYPMSEVAAALRDQQQRRVTGKAVLIPD